MCDRWVIIRLIRIKLRLLKIIGFKMPTCWIIAGPNGAGKTTFALQYLPKIAKCVRFINADSIAAGLSPLAPERELVTASRLFLKEIQHCLSRREDFAFETTLSGKTYLKLIQDLKAQDWTVELIYLALPHVEISKLRVAERVSHGGHNIPVKDIERRFSRSLHNLLHEFSSLVDHCKCFMNIGTAPELIFEQDKSTERKIIHTEYYKILLEGAQS